MNATVGYNIHNTAAYPLRTLAYLERHHLLSILRELIAAAARDQPADVHAYLAAALPVIARRYTQTRTTLLVPPAFNAHSMSLQYGRMFNAPVVQYTRQRRPNDVRSVVRRFRRFANSHGLDMKHLITFNFPNHRDEILDCLAADFAPTSVVEIMHDQNIAANRTFGQQFEQVKQYFDDRSTDLRLLANKRRPATQSSSCCLSMADVCRRVRRIVHRPRAGTLGDHRYRQPYVGEVLWHRRIVLIGRRGAGRKTQAALLANQLQLVFVDLDHLLLQHIQTRSTLGNILEQRQREHSATANPFMWSCLHQRLMRPDCLHNGYVVVGFGTAADDMRRLLDADAFAVPPNRIIFLHCRERICQHRLRRQIERHELRSTGRLTSSLHRCDGPSTDEAAPIGCAGVHLMMEPAKAYLCIRLEHEQYSELIRQTVAVAEAECGRAVYHVNGTRSVRTVHEEMLACAMAYEAPSVDYRKSVQRKMQ